MNIEAAELELYLCQYLWALKDFARETEEGFSFLRTTPIRSVQDFLIYAQKFPLPEQLQLSRAIVKGSNRPAVELLGEKFTDEDEARVNTFRAEVRNIVLPPVSNHPVTKTFAVKRAEVAKIVLTLLSSEFGNKPEKFASLQWFYRVPMGNWQFYTHLDFDGTWGTEIRYSHRLVRNDSKSRGYLFKPVPSVVGLVRVSQVFSIVSLYGLSNSIYHIDSLNDAQTAAHSILAAHHRLCQEVPDWVAHLTID